MKLDTALEEFGLLQRRRHAGEDAQQIAVALAVLREYLLDYAALEETEELSARELTGFLFEYYPRQEEPTPEVALALLDTCAAFAQWLSERGERSLAAFLQMEPRLREDLPRTLEAQALLHAHARKDDLDAPYLVESEVPEHPLGELGSGVNRLAHLDRLDYAAAEQDYFSVRKVTPDGLELTAPGRESLGEGAVTIARLPAGIPDLLRAGDIIHAEVAPGPEGWELLEVFGVRPGGYE